jgi:hypothetical protein
MERLFSPCTRYGDIVESRRVDRKGGSKPRLTEGLQEVNLDVSTAEFLSADRAFTYADLCALVGNEDTVAWLTPNTAVFRANGLAKDFLDLMVDGPCFRYSFNADGEQLYAMAPSSEALLEIVDVVLCLLAASVVRSVSIIRRAYEDVFINATSLAYLMEQCQSLKALTLEDLKVNENSCRALGACSRSGLEINLVRCTLTSAGTSALVEILGRNQGPTNLDYCNIDSFALAKGLRRNSRLKSLNPHFSNNLEIGSRQVLAIADALRENKGLVVLKLRCVMAVSDKMWNAVCDSLKTHPTLQVLNLRRVGAVPSSPALLESRIQALVDMLKVNRSIHTIHVNSRLYSEDELYRGSVIPYLETNRFRPRVHTIQKTHPMEYRAKLLGRALFASRTDANSLWMFLSGNPEVAFSSQQAVTTTSAANIPAPATANVAAAAVTTATVTVAATMAASTGSTSAVAHVATHNACLRKRKACP